MLLSTAGATRVTLLLLGVLLSGCAGAPRRAPLPIGSIESGPGSLSATRKALEGTWTLESLDIVEASGGRRRVKASGQLTYDSFGNMAVRGVAEDPALTGPLVLDYSGRITIDNVKQEFYPADLQTERPVDPSQIGPVSPDKTRRYVLTDATFVITYIDRAGKVTAVTQWRR